MLDHCWRDELRAWRYLEGALSTAIKDIEAHGTPESLDLGKFDVDEAYTALMDYVWDQQSTEELEAAKKAKDMRRLKCWLIDDRHWVIAESRQSARLVLVKDTGLIGSSVVGVDMNKKLYDENGLYAETVQEMVHGYGKPMYVGRAD
jgi:hypothetical protein